MANCIRCGRQLPALTLGKKICQWCVRHEAAQRGEEGDDAIQPVMAAPWVQRESGVSLTKVIFRRQCDGLYRDGDRQRSVARLHGQSDGTCSAPISAHIPCRASGGGCSPTCFCTAASSILPSTCGACGIWARCANLFTDVGPIAAIYLITGIAGGLASVAWNPQRARALAHRERSLDLTGALIASFYLGEFSLPGYFHSRER